MNSRNNRYVLRQAAQEDSEGIKKVFESGEFPGGISVQFLRGKNPIASLQQDGDKAVVIIAVDTVTNEIIGVGACVIRKAFVNGFMKNVGYLTGLKILPEYQKKVSFIPQAYELIYQTTKSDVDLYYTTILADNISAQKLLEKKRKYMPEYRYIGDYTVYCMGTGKKRNNLTIECGNTNGLDEFYAKHLPNINLSSIDSNLFGLKKSNFYSLRKDGDIIISCAVWNQQDYKQYLLKGYSGLYKTLSKLPTKILGYPPFPKSGEFINYASITLFCCREDVDEETVSRFLRKVIEKSQEYDLIFLGLFEGNKYNIVFNKLKHVKYKSRLYEVIWDEKPGSLQKPIHIEVGLL